MARGVDDNDNTMMGPDLAGMVQHNNGVDFWHPSWTKASRTVAPASSGTGWSSQYSDLRTLYPDTMPDWPSGITSYGSLPSTWRYGKPVPFPYAGVTSGVMVFLTTTDINFKIAGTTYNFAYPSGFATACKGYATTTYNSMIYITDGVSSVAVYRRSGTTCAEVLDFDWSADTYTADMVTRRSGVTVPSWPSPTWNTEEDVNGGDLLWTVKGKPSFPDSSSGNNMDQWKLGTSLEIPFTATQTDQFSCYSGGSCNTQFGMDMFWHVDGDGFLWAADWGHDNGGYFGCGNDSQLGMGKSAVKLAVLPEPVTG
jgi:hypothetical protein